MTKIKDFSVPVKKSEFDAKLSCRKRSVGKTLAKQKEIRRALNGLFPLYPDRFYAKEKKHEKNSISGGDQMKRAQNQKLWSLRSYSPVSSLVRWTVALVEGKHHTLF